METLAQLGLGAGIVLLLVGTVLGVRRVLQWRRLWSRHNPDQPTIQVLFHPQGTPGPSKGVGPGEEWRPLPSAAKRFDGSEMIGRRHGAPKEEARPAPTAEPTPETSVGAAESGPSEAGAERTESERDGRRVAAVERGTLLPRHEPVSDPGPFSAPRPLPVPLGDEYSEDDGDHTLQLLPGRMEAVAGGLRGREIRFIRVEGDTYTFGRQAATDASHIQLDNATVSRQHAAMRFVNGRWRIRNLSRTNPVRINGVMTDTPRKEYTLHDGDRIELGEVAFLFREQ